MMEIQKFSITYGPNVSHCQQVLEFSLLQAKRFEEPASTTPISIPLRTLYRIATCKDFCRGGDHRIENMCGRSYNHGSAALTLISMGYYDEALNLCRSLGEIANLFAFFFLKSDNYEQWVIADRKTRMKKFGPSHIRTAIDAQADFEPPMNNDRYKELCESATHVVPDTEPNKYNGMKNAGPILQSGGNEKCLDILSEVLIYISMMGAKMTKNKNAFNDISSVIDDLASH